MRRKVRIVSTFVSLALVMSVMCVGIWAASNVKLSTTSALNFNPNDVNATVAFANGSGSKEVTFGKESYTFDEDTAQADPTEALAITFAPANKTSDNWVFTVTVTNTFAESSSITIDSELSAEMLDPANSNFEVDVALGTEQSATEIAAQASVTYTVTVSIKDTAPVDAFDDTLTFTLTLEQTPETPAP